MWPLLLCLACTPASPDDTGSIPTEVVSPANDQDYAPLALELARESEERLHLVEYLIYDSGPVHELLTELGAAAERGVDVALLADETGEDTAGALSWLESRGVRTTLDSPSRTTHNKLIVSDDRVLVGSHNLTSAALESNHEASLLVADGSVADFYDGVFQALWEAPSADVDLAFEGTGDLTPLADQQVVGALESCLADASERVRVVMYAMVYSSSYPNGEPSRLVKAVADAHQRGLDVAVVLDDSDWIHDNDINDDARALLEEAGVPLALTSRSVTTHAKVLVCDDTVIVSDANWSYSGLTQYHGTSARVVDADLADHYASYCEEIGGL